MIPPHNADAERAILGAILLEGNMKRVDAQLRAGDFFLEKNRIIYATMLGMQEPIDSITLIDWLKIQGNLDVVGGPAYIALLMEEASIAVHLPAYVKIVIRDGALRELIQACRYIATEAEVGRFDHLSVKAVNTIAQRLT